MVDFAIYNKNEKRADELQEEFGLSMTLRDLYADETLTEAEVIGLQKYRNCEYPEYTGDKIADQALAEAFNKKIAVMKLTESMITDSCAKELYNNGCLKLDEAFELQRLRATKN